MKISSLVWHSANWLWHKEVQGLFSNMPSKKERVCNICGIVFEVWTSIRFLTYNSTDRVHVWIRVSWLRLCFRSFFFYQHLLHCSCPMNSALKQINSIFSVNSNSKIIFFIVFNFHFSVFSKISGIQTHSEILS